MKKFFLKNRQAIVSLLFILLFVSIYSFTAYARVGGGGGGNSGSGGGDGIGELVGILIYIFLLIPFPWNILVIAIVLIFAWWGGKMQKQQSVLNQLPTENMDEKQQIISAYIQKTPNFKPEAFKDKVKQAFTEIQDAWMQKDMKKVRKYISDGMYQRLNIQFKMMNILEQTNTIENLVVKNIIIDKIESDGIFDIIHVAIHASIVDKFVSKKYSSLNSGGSEEFIEYWSFIKKKSAKESDLFGSQNCPNCGAQLPENAGDVSQCPYCKTITNLGDYDWILSEITQADDYIGSYSKISKESSFAQKINELCKSNPDFSIQNIEDKVSNGYLQILTAQALNQPAIMRRFVSDELYDRLNQNNSGDIVYNRIYLNDVTLIGARQQNNKNILSIAVKSTYQRVSLKDGKMNLLDSILSTKTETVLISRDINASESKGSLYAHVCPVCAGPLKDTTDIKCQYCGSDLNSTKTEWIITDILTSSDYKEYYQENKADFIAGVDIDKLDSLFNVRDYAFNNILVVMAADGKFEQAELEMAQKIAKKFGYSVDKIQPMFEMAKSQNLTIRMPDNQKKQQKIFSMMEKAAAVDGAVSPEEKALLDSVKQQYSIQ